MVFDALVLRAPFSGVEYAVSEQARALAGLSGAGFRFTILWPASLPEPAAPEPVAPHRLLRAGPRLRSRALRLLWEQLLLPRRLRALGADLLHAPAYLAPLAAPCPTVLSVYDLHALDDPAHCRVLNRWNYRLFLPASIRRAARILVPSDHTRDAVLRRFPALAGRVRVVPLGIPARFRPDPPVPPAGAGVALPFAPGRYLLCVGNLEPRKNLPLAVEALALLRRQGFADLGLVVAGHATMGDPALERAIRRHGLEAAVARPGYVPEAALPGLYAQAAALVYPARDEGFGLPPLEAMACGCPVLCADSGTLRQTTGGAALHVAPLDAAALAQAVAPLLASPACRAEWAARALGHAAQHRWPALIHRVVEVYREVRPPAAGPDV